MRAAILITVLPLAAAGLILATPDAPLLAATGVGLYCIVRALEHPPRSRASLALVGAHRSRARRRVLVEVHVDLSARRGHDRRASASVAPRASARAGSVRRLRDRDDRVPSGAALEFAARLDRVRLSGATRTLRAAGIGAARGVEARGRFLRRTGRARVADSLHHARDRRRPIADASSGRRAIRARDGRARVVRLLRLQRAPPARRTQLAGAGVHPGDRAARDHDVERERANVGCGPASCSPRRCRC